MEELSDHIGELLRKAREDADLVVDDVVFRTRIPKSVVEALEAGDFSVFSSPTYARSFLSQYSGFLNVDAQVWMDALEPLAYASGDIELSGAGSGYSRRSVVQAAPESSGGWLAAAGMLAISAGFVLAAVKGYEFLDGKHGGEIGSAESTEGAPMTKFVDLVVDETVFVEPPELSEERRQTASLPVPGIVEPPPRATIIRDDR